MASSTAAVALRLTDGVYEEGLSDVLRGLLHLPRKLSHVWLYDERGCRLFEKICELPEYYLTRTEMAIMREYAPAIAARLGDDFSLIEYGSGSAGKTRLLLDALPTLRAYAPVDISASSLARAARLMQRHYPELQVLPLCADFTRPLELPEGLGDARRVVYFPGSTLGNYERADAVRLLSEMRSLAGASGAALIGIDLVKDPLLLERAYDDAQGVTAEFNLNTLRHLNRRLGIGFEMNHFRHRAVWVEPEQRIEMHLVSALEQTIRVGAAVIRLQRGEFIRSECSHKYTSASFAALVAEAGWRVSASWSDREQWFGVQLLESA